MLPTMGSSISLIRAATTPFGPPPPLPPRLSQYAPDCTAHGMQAVADVWPPIGPRPSPGQLIPSPSQVPPPPPTGPSPHMPDSTGPDMQAIADALPPVGPRPSPGLPIPSPSPGDQLQRGSISRLNMQPMPGWNPKLRAMTQTEIPAVREVSSVVATDCDQVSQVGKVTIKPK